MFTHFSIKLTFFTAPPSVTTITSFIHSSSLAATISSLTIHHSFRFRLAIPCARFDGSADVETALVILPPLLPQPIFHPSNDCLPMWLLDDDGAGGSGAW